MCIRDRKYPGLKIVGVHNGYFDEKEEKKIIQDIKKKAPSILLVGLGAPKQEKWIYDNIRLVGAKVAIGVGGSFDVMAGNVKRAPKIFRRLGLEWFHRLITQPTRWRRMMRLPKFALTVLSTRAVSYTHLNLCAVFHSAFSGKNPDAADEHGERASGLLRGLYPLCRGDKLCLPFGTAGNEPVPDSDGGILCGEGCH